MHGIRRVLVFCTLTTILPTMLLLIPLYLRHSFYANVAYAVTESDILEITDGISTIFCSEHTLQMNGTFNAFQMTQKPEITSYRKHIRLKKSMNLPDDTLEYWGFYLLKGATVALSVCSRFQGASILVVKGERNLRTCGMLEHNDNKEIAEGIFFPDANRQVKITFESNAQEIQSGEFKKTAGNNIKSNITETHKNSDVNVNYTNVTTETIRLENEENDTRFDADVNNTKTSNETVHERELEELLQTAKTYVGKHISPQQAKNANVTRRLRHASKRHRKKEKGDNISLREGRRKGRHREQNKEAENEIRKDRLKRSQELVKPPSLLDQGIRHGGNAGRNVTDSEDESSVSSFENGLFTCYGGSILLAHEFPPSDQCVNVSYLLGGKHMETKHNIVEDGYYYYIFYSDNDIVSNDIHALFDIYKPTFQYENVTKSCINQTECSFSLDLMSPDRVIVEIPTKDGIEDELDDVSLLISICHPRMGVYIIFPIAVLFFILTCAFM